MAEWLIAPVLKTGGPQGLGGSNPSPSAINKERKTKNEEIGIGGDGRGGDDCLGG